MYWSQYSATTSSSSSDAGCSSRRAVSSASSVKWLKRHPRFHVHFTPTGSSWLNMVERFFRDLTQNRLRRGTFRDVEELIMAVEGYIHNHNQNPQPFILTAKAAGILEKVKPARRARHNRPSA